MTLHMKRSCEIKRNQKSISCRAIYRMKRLPTYIHKAQAWIYQHEEWLIIFSSYHTDRIGNSRWGMHRFRQHLLRHKKRTIMDMHHFRVVFFLRICTTRNKYFPRATKLLSSVHFNTLSTWSSSEMFWALFMYTFLIFPYTKQSRERERERGREREREKQERERSKREREREKVVVHCILAFAAEKILFITSVFVLTYFYLHMYNK